MAKAILIDVENKTFKNVELSEGLEDIYANLKCDCFTVTRGTADCDCFVDDEGLLKNGYIDEDGKRHNLSGFQINQGEVLMGNGLLVGLPDAEGATTDITVSISDVESQITFVDYDKNEDKPQPFMEFYSL